MGELTSVDRGVEGLPGIATCFIRYASLAVVYISDNSKQINKLSIVT